LVNFDEVKEYEKVYQFLDYAVGPITY